MNRFHNQSSLLVCDTNITPILYRASVLCKNFQKKVIFYDLGEFFVNLEGFLTQSSSFGNKIRANQKRSAIKMAKNKKQKSGTSQFRFP